jgi:protocatechuate 3,4-dioxygenase alpha subunit
MAATPSQTVGPFFRIELARGERTVLVANGAVELEGRVLDGAGEPVSDALVELWQADETGTYRDDFGWGRCGTDGDGRYAFTTAKPGPVEGQAPHLVLLVFARGLLKPCLTRMYFPDEPANATDAVLEAVDDRDLLIAREEAGRLHFDIRLQGEAQTPFFAV